MSKLSVGIVGLPNVGKSTLFNALLRKQAAYAANFPFATIEPNVGVVPVPDRRLEFLAETIASPSNKLQISSDKQDTNDKIQFSNKDDWPPTVPATVEFVDIAGLIAGAHKGEGLGNKFLAHIREVDAITHVVRYFANSDIVKEGSVDPAADLETIETELILADLATLENTTKKLKKDGNKHKISAHDKLMKALGDGKPARSVELTKDESHEATEFFLLTAKPVMIVLNVGEEDLTKRQELEEEYSRKFNLPVDSVIALSAKLEEDLSSLDVDDQVEYLKDHGIDSPGLNRVIKKAFATLGLITFLTAGEKEVRAWTIHRGDLAPQAAGTIHTDFEGKFIKADVVKFHDFVENNGWKGSREHGKVRSEGKDYEMNDGDIVEFKIGS